MSTPKSDASPEASDEAQSEDHLLFQFTDEDDEEVEEGPELEVPYCIRNTDGQLQIVKKLGDYPVVATAQVDGVSYCWRQMDRHLLFRNLDSPPAADALFLPDTMPDGFAATLRRRPPGRCILYITHEEYFDYELCYYLYFEIDGSGFALHANTGKDPKSRLWTLEWERVEFRWDDFPGMEAVLSAPVEELRELCGSLFEERINRRLRMPVLDHEELPRIPLTWLSGSQADFRWLTQAICLTEPGLMEAEGPIVAVYKAEIKGKRGCFLHVERGSRYGGDRYTSRRMSTLCELAFRLNPFTGSEWYHRSSSYGEHRQLQESALRLKVEIDTPTAHEKAEAHLMLQDWIDEKLHDPEKRARCSVLPTSLS